MTKHICFVLLLFLHVTISLASMVEKQKYRVVKSYDGYEIRYYPAATLATVYTSANSYREIATPGFRALAGYIFGGIASDMKISMTSPVHMDINDSLSGMSFVMPSKYEMKDLPSPSNSKVILHESEPEYVAALRFGGYASDRAIRRHSEKLAKLLDEAGISYFANFRYLGYNPPYQFIGRRNEIIVAVSWSEER